MALLLSYSDTICYVLFQDDIELLGVFLNGYAKFSGKQEKESIIGVWVG